MVLEFVNASSLEEEERVVSDRLLAKCELMPPFVTSAVNLYLLYMDYRISFINNL